MTITTEEPGILVATCDQCGERRNLAADTEEDVFEAEAELIDLGWVSSPPERVRYVDGISSGLVITYAQDFCPDCQGDEPRPHPRFGSGRVARAAVAPLANDPVDEWPRAKIFETVGLRSACGHPPGDAMCPYCERGLPIGDTRPGWRR